MTIQGEELDHLFCHCVLPYSDWQWATRCISESFLSLVTGLQAALGQLGKCPPHLGTDNTSAATHELEQMPGRPRGYNSGLPGTMHALRLDALDDQRRLSARARGCGVAEPAFEAAPGAAPDFAWQPGVCLAGGLRPVCAGVLRAANAKRQKRLAEELACMRPLPAGRLAEYREYATGGQFAESDPGQASIPIRCPRV